MALIHEKLHRSPDLARVDMADYIRSLATCLSRSAEVNPGQIVLKVDVAGGPLGIDTAIPCGLIINELVSNALKHAFPEGQKGAIGIDLRPEGEKRLALTVRDNGVGLPGHVDVRHTESLGWQLVNALTHQLGGALEITNGAGTCVRITFEELRYKERWAHHG
jgi:two-component sensor histidine kinase